MRRISALALGSAALCVMAGSAQAGEDNIGRYDWTGLYVGAHTGGALGTSDISDPFGTPIFGDNVRTPGPFAGVQIGYLKQSGSTVFGVEADANWADLDGTNTCFQVSPTTFLGVTCNVHTDAFGTLTGRLGAAVGPNGRTMLYGKGGLAWAHENVDMATNPLNSLGTSRTTFSQLGWTVGVGAEYALTRNWSAKLEYDFLTLGSHDIATPNAGIGAFGPDGRTASLREDIHALMLGLNYKIGGASTTSDSDRAWTSLRDQDMQFARGYEFQSGARYVYGWGRFQKDLGVAGQPLPANRSRLTYDDLKTSGAEVFARLDTPHNLMVKGFVGMGRGNGRLNDEDWILDIGPKGAPNIVPYSNTLSDVNNNITYWTIDVGYDWIRTPNYKVASFVGYNHYTNNMDGFGCSSIFNGGNCSPGANFPGAPTTTLVIAERDKWDSIRLGTAAEFMLAPQIKLSGDVAYLPYVRFEGIDDHNPNGTGRISPETGHGTGVQLEGMLSYSLTDQLSLGVGGRYWAMRTTSAETDFNGSGLIIPQRFATEQAAVLVQGTYKFGAPATTPLK